MIYGLFTDIIFHCGSVFYCVEGLLLLVYLLLLIVTLFWFMTLRCLIFIWYANETCSLQYFHLQKSPSGYIGPHTFYHLHQPNALQDAMEHTTSEMRVDATHVNDCMMVWMRPLVFCSQQKHYQPGACISLVGFPITVQRHTGWSVGPVVCTGKHD